MTVAALLAALAYAVWSLPGTAASRVRALPPPDGVPAPAARAVPLAAAAGCVALVTLGPAAAVACAATAYAARRALRRRAAHSAARAVAAALPDLCRATAAELRAGAPPAAALAAAAADAPPPLAAHLRTLAATADHHPPPPAAWADLAGAERLRAVGALWAVAAHAGSGLADGLDRLAAALAAEHRQRAEVAAQLAGPTASAAVLALLPLCGVALAAALGARPGQFLLRTPAGLLCLLAGAGLDAAGVWWVRRLTTRATA